MNTLETHPVNPTTNKPTPDIRIKDVIIFVDPFEEFLKKKRTEEQTLQNKAAAPDDEDESSRRKDDEQMTWTGKRVRDTNATAANDGSAAGVGKYLKAALAERQAPEEDEIVEFVDDEPEPEPMRKKFKGTGGFGDFSSWS